MAFLGCEFFFILRGGLLIYLILNVVGVKCGGVAVIYYYFFYFWPELDGV